MTAESWFPDSLWPCRLKRRGRVHALIILLFFVAAEAHARPARFQHSSDETHRERCQNCHKIANLKTGSLRLPASQPLHAPCDTCHGREWRKAMFSIRGRRPSRAGFCATCHVGRKGLRYPPYLSRGASFFTLADYDHRAHADLDDTRCEDCHGSGGARDEPAPHPSCAGCHDGDPAPAMNACEGCHVATASAAPSQFEQVDEYRIMGFDHDNHRKKSPKATCASCHVGQPSQPGEPMPRPRKPDCETCHDGRQAFSVVEAKCGRCHIAPRSPE